MDRRGFVEIFFFGKVHKETIAFDDEVYLNKLGGHKIHQIKIWFNKHFIFGIQCVYYIFATGQLVEGGRHHKNTGESVLEEVITLGKDEFIVEAHGRHGELIDAIGFRTTKDRNFLVGGHGGQPWSVKAPFGHHLSTIKGGYRKELDHIEFKRSQLPQIGFSAPQVQIEILQQQQIPQTLYPQFPQQAVIQPQQQQFVQPQPQFVQPQGQFVQPLPDQFVQQQQQQQQFVQPQQQQFVQPQQQQFVQPQQQQFVQPQQFPQQKVTETIITQQQGFGGSTTTIQTFTTGRSHPDTQVFNDTPLFSDNQGHKISALKIITNGKFIFGIEAHYYIYANGQHLNGGRHCGHKHNKHCFEEIVKFEQDEFLTEVYGRWGDQIHAIGFKTSKGRVISAFGGQEGQSFGLIAPFGQHFNTIFGGLGGHIHHIGFGTATIPQNGGGYSQQSVVIQNQNNYSFPQQQQQQQQQQFVHPSIIIIEGYMKRFPNHPYFSRPLLPNIRISEMFGNVNKDSRFFDDFHNVTAKLGVLPQISQITVYYGQYVVGIQVFYRTPAGFVQGGLNLGSTAQQVQPFQATLQLDIDEYITVFKGRAGDIVDHLHIKTSKGKVLEAGGTGGNNHANLLPHGSHGSHQIVGIGGAVNGHLHNIYLYYV